MAHEQDPWSASLPCYASDESGPDAAQEPPRKKQRKLWHSSDAAMCTVNLQCDSPATPDLTSVQCSADSRDRSCSPPEAPHPHSPADLRAPGSDGRRQAAWAVQAGPRCTSDELGRLGDWPPDAPLSPPHIPKADPAPLACAGARGESVGFWIDAALADEGWWWAEDGAGWSIWGGCFEDSDERFDALLAGAEAVVR